jgi:serine phosphatase RsbU (regulator of sigma subunit)
MANLQGCFRSHAEGRTPAALLRDVNRLFWKSTPPEQYATVFFARYEESSRSLYYINCGHLPPVLARASGGVERLEGDATVLGVFSNWDCEQRLVRLNPGDTLIVFSDGITEAGIDAGAEFGEDRLIELIEANRNLPAGALVDQIVEAARGYSPTQTDDITVICLRGV